MNERNDRFVVLYHEVGSSLSRTDQSHLDWMFESGDSLRTWASPVVESLENEFEIKCDRLPNHRSSYLDFEGLVEGDRGTVTRVIAGKYRLIEDRSLRFAVELSWYDPNECVAKAIFYRTTRDSESRNDEKLGTWTLRFLVGR